MLLAFAFQRDDRQKVNTAFLDALILNLAERTPDVEGFITWNARHFKKKSSLKVLTPQEYLKQEQGCKNNWGRFFIQYLLAHSACGLTLLIPKSVLFVVHS